MSTLWLSEAGPDRGYPAMDEALERALNRGKVVLGGCLIPADGPPDWKCGDCGLEYSNWKLNAEERPSRLR